VLPSPVGQGNQTAAVNFALWEFVLNPERMRLVCFKDNVAVSLIPEIDRQGCREAAGKGKKRKEEQTGTSTFPNFPSISIFPSILLVLSGFHLRRG
jgi:hypothetical protein